MIRAHGISGEDDVFSPEYRLDEERGACELLAESAMTDRHAYRFGGGRPVTDVPTQATALMNDGHGSIGFRHSGFLASSGTNSSRREAKLRARPDKVTHEDRAQQEIKRKINQPNEAIKGSESASASARSSAASTPRP
jgi:hypothetical protein